MYIPCRIIIKAAQRSLIYIVSRVMLATVYVKFLRRRQLKDHRAFRGSILLAAPVPKNKRSVLAHTTSNPHPVQRHPEKSRFAQRTTKLFEDIRQPILIDYKLSQDGKSHPETLPHRPSILHYSTPNIQGIKVNSIR